MKIGKIDTNKEVFIIAEVGNNHEGDFALAQKMVGLAAESGADAVKFQTIIPNRLVSAANKDRIAQLSRFQFSYEQFAELKKTADRAGILFMSTPFDLESARFLDSLVPAFKISSGDNDFFPLIEEVAKTGKPIILSTGLASEEEILRVRDFIQTVWKAKGIQQEMALLHCVSSYPVPEEQANIAAVASLKKFGVTVGYSDHTLGIEAAALAVAAGARVIEKHFTIDKNHSSFRDHQLSADPQDMKALVKHIRAIEKCLGVGSLSHQPCEEAGLQNFRRSIVAARDMEAGQELKLADLGWVRPRSGLKPGQENLLIGRKLKKAIPAGIPILEQDVN